MSNSTLSPEERFWARVTPEPNTGCWLWMGAPANGIAGYGQLNVNGHSVRAHRYSYELHIGPIPRGLYALHRCDVRECVNPDHIWLGTKADNNRDRDEKGRQARGSAHGFSRLTEEDVLEIRRSPLSQRALAARYGVSRSTIHQAQSGKTWKHI